MKTKKHIGLKIFCAFLVTLGTTAALAVLWYTKIYGDTGISSVIFTLAAGVEGAESGLVINYLTTSLLPALAISAGVSFIILYSGRFHLAVKNRKRGKTFKFYPFSVPVKVVVSVVICLALLFTSVIRIGFDEYVMGLVQGTKIYDEYYVSPDDVDVKFPEEKRNLIIIYLESMETTYLSKELGGALEYNAIPELYDLAEDNINFSQDEGVGGWGTVNNTTWTMAALVAQTAGIPFTISVDSNAYNQFENILPGAKSINNILSDAGYKQTIVFGSDADYGGRKKYYTQHGVDNVYDLHTAREEGFIPEDYHEWWGFEDDKLFDYAKLKLTEAAAGSEPFAFTMLTADTHHVDGYLCEDCEQQYDEQYSNVIACSSRKTGEFVEWIRSQDFYENTTIVMCGDHQSMDAEYFARNVSPDYVRRNYNCIINSPIEADNTKNRVFTPMDMFPTTLAAIGCEIEGERLGLGTNLFSGEPTLAESLGFDYFNKEISKYSKYYINRFVSSD